MRFFFLNHPATTDIYTLSLHDALPISTDSTMTAWTFKSSIAGTRTPCGDRKSTRLNSSHTVISYAVFCLKKKNFPAYRDRRCLVDDRESYKWSQNSFSLNCRSSV